MDETFPDNSSTQIDSLCVERIEKIFSSFDINADGGVVTEDAMIVSKKANGSVTVQVIERWLHSWATPRRKHVDPLLSCLLGCTEAQDDLSHYVMCPHL